MEIIVHRGTRQTGGCVTEYRAGKTRIFVDFGSEPGGESTPSLSIEGVTKGETDCAGVFMTHHHEDHIGMIDKLNPDIPVYMGEAAKDIALLVNSRSGKNRCKTQRLEKAKTFRAGEAVLVGDIRVTPIKTDHSAYDSYMFLIEAEGKTVLHTGDFRTHGFREKNFIARARAAIRGADALVCEGTTLGERVFPLALSEGLLRLGIKLILMLNKYVFVLCSPTNVDRVAGVCSVVPSGRFYLCDDFQLDILARVRRAESENPLYSFGGIQRYSPNLDGDMAEKGFCMFVRAGCAEHMRIMEKFGHLKPLVIFSVKKANVEKEAFARMLEGRRRVYIHTGGHAHSACLSKLIRAVRPRLIIPIHTSAPEKFLPLAGRSSVVFPKDGEAVRL